MFVLFSCIVLETMCNHTWSYLVPNESNYVFIEAGKRYDAAIDLLTAVV